MKKAVFFVIVMIFTLSATMAFASKSDLKSEKSAIPVKTENKLTEEEMTRLTKRVEEIRAMDKTDLSVKEKRELNKELRVIKENVKKSGGYIYIGGGSLLLIIILIILLV